MGLFDVFVLFLFTMYSSAVNRHTQNPRGASLLGCFPIIHDPPFHLSPAEGGPAVWPSVWLCESDAFIKFVDRRLRTPLGTHDLMSLEIESENLMLFHQFY